MTTSVQNLSVSFDGKRVVDGIDLQVGPGECLAIVGESGSGKTMTALALLGLVPAGGTVTADRLVVAGTDARELTDRQWRSLRGRRAALVSQDALVSLDPLRRVGREVAETVEVHGGRRLAVTDPHVLEQLQAVRVPEPERRAREYPHELSGGLRQRALIASALTAAPELLIADEPTTALDATVQAQILKLLAELKDGGLSLVLVSHDLAVVAELADRVAVMRQGMIVEQGAIASVLSAPAHEYTRMLLEAAPTGRRSQSANAGSDAEPVLEVRGVTKAFRGRGRHRHVAVDDASFTLHRGRTVGIVGESGSGKTTLAHMVLGLLAPDSGEVLLEGEPWSALPEAHRRARRARLQLIDQDPFSAFDPRWSVSRTLREAVQLDMPRSGRAEVDARVVQLLEQVGLGAAHLRRRPHELSGGQRQRVAIARALARRPAILVCDEPVSALDVSIQAQVLELLESLQRELGLSMVFISHDLAVIGQVSDDILVMKDGRIVEQGQAAAVLSAPTHAFTAELVRSARL